jgi:hypothetical protein
MKPLFLLNINLLSFIMEIFKRSKEGKIDFHLGKTNLFSGGVGNMGPMAYDGREKYFSKDKVHLLAVSYDNLSKNLSDNPKSMEFRIPP